MTGTIKTAPDTGVECSLCGEDTYADYDGDLVCTNCYFAPNGNRKSETKSEWIKFWEHRAAEYSGTYGEDRKKVVGSFASAY